LRRSHARHPSRHACWRPGRRRGASARTIARLFRNELGTTFVRWREQVLLARAVPLAARRMPMAAIAELGYASPSAFAAMVKRSVGSPMRFFRAGG
jgi:AraC-like DNA-binding protein